MILAWCTEYNTVPWAAGRPLAPGSFVRSSLNEVGVDPLTQGLLGAAAAHAVCGRQLPRSAWIIGLSAGMAADLDILIRPASDPLGGVTYHRHFTHALAFIPIGAAISALPFLIRRRYPRRRWCVVIAALVAYATHGLLDACTSYGTVLLWPFTEKRFAWDWIGIIDPAFTSLLLAGLGTAVWSRRRRWAALGLSLALFYLAVGAVQHGRVKAVQETLAATRGHLLLRGRAMPTPMNLVLWRSVYIADGRVYADAVRVPWFNEPQVRRGGAATVVTRDTLKERGYRAPDVLHAFDRFRWFADGYTAFDDRHPGRWVADVRYCLTPERVTSLWGLRLPALPRDPAQRAEFAHHPRPRGAALREMWHAIVGKDDRFRRVGLLGVR